ncbi:MAG: hypothetical protein GXO04_00290 [Aquificae bacterium]|nr:hypothetical protein [Aquificota bacterium]
MSERFLVLFCSLGFFPLTLWLLALVLYVLGLISSEEFHKLVPTALALKLLSQPLFGLFVLLPLYGGFSLLAFKGLKTREGKIALLFGFFITLFSAFA